MAIKRIVFDIATTSPEDVRKFYETLFGLETVMDQGWITTLSAGRDGPIQISIATEGGSGAQVPDVSIEVDDVDAIHARAQECGFPIAYALTDEPWGVRRFFLFDPAGKLLNVLSHLD